MGGPWKDPGISEGHSLKSEPGSLLFVKSCECCLGVVKGEVEKNPGCGGVSCVSVVDEGRCGRGGCARGSGNDVGGSGTGGGDSSESEGIELIVSSDERGAGSATKGVSARDVSFRVDVVDAGRGGVGVGGTIGGNHWSIGGIGKVYCFAACWWKNWSISSRDWKGGARSRGGVGGGLGHDEVVIEAVLYMVCYDSSEKKTWNGDFVEFYPPSYIPRRLNDVIGAIIRKR